MRPESWQACISCGNEVVETDPNPRCGRCGGLLEVHHRPPEMRAQELIQQFTERRGRKKVSRTFSLAFRTLTVPQMVRRLEKAGFEITALLGDYRGREWDPRADVWVILARRT